jgi:hypothetical protein
MQVESLSKLWLRQRKEMEAHRLGCWTGNFELHFADYEIVVRSFGRVCTARIIWDHGYGERALERGPCTSVFAHIARIMRNGPTFGPVHEGDGDELRFVEFESDGSFRATRPHGEVRVKRFLDQYVLLFVPDGGFRAIHVSRDPDELKMVADVYGPEWTSCSGPRYAVRFGGRVRELHVSHNPSELAYHDIDEDTRFSLIPYSLPEGDRPAQAALYLFQAEEKTQLLALVPIEPTIRDPVIWSEEQPAQPDPADRSRERQTGASPPSSSASPPEVEPAGSTAMPPGLRALVARYLGDVAEKPGSGKEMREQSEKLLRAVERGNNVSGWGAALRSAVERACDNTFVGSSRAFCYLVKALKDDRILARPWGRKCQLVFSELRHPDSPAIARLCQRYGAKPESVFGTEVVDLPPPDRAPSPPVGRPPSTTPPAGAPTPAARERAMHMSPSPAWPPTTPATPPAGAPTLDRDRPASSSASPDWREREQASHSGSAPDSPAAPWQAPPPSGPSPAPTFGTGQSEDPFAIIQRMLGVDSVRTGSSTIHVPPIAPSTTFVPPIASVPSAPPEDFMKPEYMFLDPRTLRSSAEPTDKDLESEDSDGFPRGPPDEE